MSFDLVQFEHASNKAWECVSLIAGAGHHAGSGAYDFAYGYLYQLDQHMDRATYATLHAARNALAKVSESLFPHLDLGSAEICRSAHELVAEICRVVSFTLVQPVKNVQSDAERQQLAQLFLPACRGLLVINRSDVETHILRERARLLAPPPSVEQAARLPEWPPLLTAAELAQWCGASKDAVNAFLKRFLKDHPNCRIEVANPQPHEPRYLYHTSIVGPPMRERYLKPNA